MKLLKKIFLIWLLFIPIVFMNGLVRNFIYRPYIGDLAAHQISTVIAILVFITISYSFAKKEFLKATNEELLSAGVLWVILTMVFEFGFGHYIMGNTWDTLFSEYNLLNGHIWGLFLIVVLFTPLIIRRMAVKT